MTRIAVRRAWTLAIDDWTPPSVNRLWKSHWRVGHKLKVQAARVVAVHAYLSDPRIPAATGRRRVGVAVVMAGRGRLIDPDNALKCLMDALKVNRLIVDDSARFLELGRVSVERGERKRTVITLEDLP